MIAYERLGLPVPAQVPATLFLFIVQLCRSLTGRCWDSGENRVWNGEGCLRSCPQREQEGDWSPGLGLHIWMTSRGAIHFHKPGGPTAASTSSLVQPSAGWAIPSFLDPRSQPPTYTSPSQPKEKPALNKWTNTSVQVQVPENAGSVKLWCAQESAPSGEILQVECKRWHWCWGTREDEERQESEDLIHTSNLKEKKKSPNSEKQETGWMVARR